MAKRKFTSPEDHVAVDSSDAVAVFGNSQEELPVHSQVLRIASPVFNAMFTSGMTEATTRRIEIDLASKDDFHDFYKCLLPGGSSDLMLALSINAETIGSMLALSDYYQIIFLKDACIRVLEGCPGTTANLILAKKYGLSELYKKFLQDVMSCRPKQDFTILRGHSDILIDCLNLEEPQKPQSDKIADFKACVLDMHSHVGGMLLGQRLGNTDVATIYPKLCELRDLL